MFCACISGGWLQPFVAEWITVLSVDRGACLTASHAAFVITAEPGHCASCSRFCYLYHSVNKTAAFLINSEETSAS